MKVILAGYNVDREVIDDLKRHSPPRADVTPETVSAAYARISRNPAPVNELRAAAREGSGKGEALEPGHRLRHGAQLDCRARRLQHRRLGVSRPARRGDREIPPVLLHGKIPALRAPAGRFVLPEEIREAGLAESFTRTVKAQKRFYHRLYEGLLPWVLDQNQELAASPANRSHRWKAGPRRMRATCSAWPRRPSSG